MTVEASEAIDVYTAVGGETEFAYTFPIDIPIAPNSSDIGVVTDENGIITTLVEGVDYTVTGAGNPNGGNIVLDVFVFVGGATAGVIFAIFRNTPVTRNTDFQTLGDFFATEINDQLDKLTRLIQDQTRDQGFNLRLPRTAVGLSREFPPPGALEFVRWNAAGDELETITLLDAGGTLPVDETDTDPVKNKVVSNALAKKWEDTADVVPTLPTEGDVIALVIALG